MNIKKIISTALMCATLIPTMSFADSPFINTDLNNLVKNAYNNGEIILDINKLNIKDESVLLNILCENWHLDIANMGTYKNESGSYDKLIIKYLNKEDTEYVNEQLNLLVEKLKSETANMSKEKRIRYVCYYIINNYKYKSGCNNVCNFFKDHTGNCSSFSRVFKAIMDRLGYDCCLVTDKNHTHMWNGILLKNKWYHIDLVYNIAKFSTDYYLVSDKTLLRNKSDKFRKDYYVFDDAYITNKNNDYFKNKKNILKDSLKKIPFNVIRDFNTYE